MATAIYQTVRVKVPKGKMTAFKKMLRETGIGEISEPPATQKESFESGKFKEGDTPASILARFGKVSFKYETLEDLRKDAWKREK